MPKFLFVVLCFCIAAGSYFFCRSRRDWAWLAGGMAFTVWADYFLVLRNVHVAGVAVFCFAHVCYTMRAWNAKKARLLYIVIVTALAAVAWSGGNVVFLTGIYAVLFAVNIGVNVKNRHRMPHSRRIITGLILFALCDVCVLLFNLPRYAGVYPQLVRIYPFIWLFYLPAQVLLATSAVKSKERVHEHTRPVARHSPLQPHADHSAGA